MTGASSTDDGGESAGASVSNMTDSGDSSQSVTNARKSATLCANTVTQSDVSGSLISGSA